jgi:hypothetical protein
MIVEKRKLGIEIKEGALEMAPRYYGPKAGGAVKVRYKSCLATLAGDF